MNHVTEAKPEPRQVLHVRFRPASIERIDAEAKRDRRNRSDMVRVLVLEALEAREAQRKGSRQ